MCVYSPMAAGFLSGKYDKAKGTIEGARFALGHLGLRYNQQYWEDSNFEAVDKLKQVASSHGRKMAQFALSWVLQQRAITSVVCGASSLTQLEQNLEATDIKLSDIPLSSAARYYFDYYHKSLIDWSMVLTQGDDYELCFTCK